MEKFLENYPFSDSRVKLVEGFSAYDGVIGDTPGEAHKGIDYVLILDDAYLPFAVASMHDGMAFHGTSDTWGKFVIIYKTMDRKHYNTIYAHLDEVSSNIPLQFLGKDGKRVLNEDGFTIRAGEFLGTAGITGATNGIVQLHIELHEKDLVTGLNQKLDPYGVNDRASSGQYPQPSQSLSGLNHFWFEDKPHFSQPRVESEF
ncbi:MAG: M23 family metallopeptidase [Patescibacteria group bacterium]